MAHVARKLRGCISRVLPGCLMQAQAVAFNMFLAFFPMLLFALGLMTTSIRMQGAIKDLPGRLSAILPPGSERVVLDYLIHRGEHPGRWIWLGLGGVLLAGTQVMIGLMDGFREIANDPIRPPFWRRQLRALFLLCLTIVPALAAITLTVFGRQVRAWLLVKLGLPDLVRILMAAAYICFELLLALGVLVIVYRIGRPHGSSSRTFLPGAFVATILWWVLDVSLGFYVRHVPYGAVYGGLAAAIGLLLWMYMTAMVIFIGAAYNAESGG
jgi:membrane protein